LIRPLFFFIRSEHVALAAPDELASAIIESVDAGARLLNLSLSVAPATAAETRRIQEALNYAHARGVIVVAAAGNQAAIGGSVLTRHPSVVPVVAYDDRGHPAPTSNFGRSIGQSGVGAPGVGVTSLAADGGSRRFGGTSAAAAFVTGTIALLWSEFPNAPASEIRSAVVTATTRRVSVVPPLLNAWAAFETLQNTRRGFADGESRPS
jgi:subtilisin family serine protease